MAPTIHFDAGNLCLSTGPIARLLGVHTKTVAGLIDRGAIPGHRVPGAQRGRRVRVADLVAYLRSQGLDHLVPYVMTEAAPAPVERALDAPPLARGDLRLLQARQRAWALKNFGDGTPRRVLAGTGELLLVLCRIGLLNHAHLKESQGIRGESDQHRAAARKAVAASIACLLAYARARGWQVEPIMDEAMTHEVAALPTGPLGHHAIFGMAEEVGELAAAHATWDESAAVDACGDVAIYWLDYLTRRGLDAADTLETVADRVFGRDWLADPQGGGEHADESPV
jgi:excisionase family DNA binding protein